MLDDGLGTAVYEELTSTYDFSDQLDIYDVGCMSLTMLSYVNEYDLLISVDALDGTGEQPGTIFRFKPEDMARHTNAMQSLHDMKLVDLFDAAALKGYEAQGVGLGMQIENSSPADLTIGLTQKVYEALPRLVDTVLAELVGAGVVVRVKADGRIVDASWKHQLHGTTL